MASDFISDIGKGKKQGVVEAIAGTDLSQRIINSPLAQSTGATLRGLASGAAVPTAFAIDSVNTGVNAVNSALGGSSNLLPTDNTKQVINWGMGGENGKPQPIASGSTPLPAPVQSSSASAVAQPLGAVQATSAAPAIAGGKQNAFSGTSPVIALNGKNLGDTTAISNRVDWSPGSKNAQAYIAGAEYDQQVAKAKEVNANTMQQLGNISPKQQFDMTFVGAADASNPSYRNAMLNRDTWTKNNANNQAELGRQNQLNIADTNAEAHKYAADQSLEGHKYTADASVKSHQIAGDASVKAHEIQALGQQRAAQAKAGAEASKVANEQADNWLKSNGYELSPENRQSAITHANQMNNFYGKFGEFAVKNGITNPSDPRLITWRNIAQNAASGKPWDKSLGIAQEDYNQAITTLKNHGVIIPKTPSFTLAKKNEMPGTTQNPA